jgi:hypothetical protein
MVKDISLSVRPQILARRAPSIAHTHGPGLGRYDRMKHVFFNFFNLVSYILYVCNPPSTFGLAILTLDSPLGP